MEDNLDFKHPLENQTFCLESKLRHPCFETKSGKEENYRRRGLRVVWERRGVHLSFIVVFLSCQGSMTKRKICPTFQNLGELEVRGRA